MEELVDVYKREKTSYVGEGVENDSNLSISGLRLFREAVNLLRDFRNSAITRGSAVVPGEPFPLEF